MSKTRIASINRKYNQVLAGPDAQLDGYGPNDPRKVSLSLKMHVKSKDGYVNIVSLRGGADPKKGIISHSKKVLISANTLTDMNLQYVKPTRAVPVGQWATSDLQDNDAKKLFAQLKTMIKSNPRFELVIGADDSDVD